MTNDLVVYTDNNVRVIPVFQNEGLRVATKRIVEYIRGVGINYFKIAIQLKVVKDLELFKDDNFESVYDYAEKVFGYSKSSVVRMIKTAELYLEEDGSSTIFLKEGKDFGISQLRELLSLPKSEVIDLVQEGKLTPEMTKDQIRVVVRAKKNEENKEEEGSGIESESISSSLSGGEHELKSTSLSVVNSLLSSSIESSLELPSQSHQVAPESTETNLCTSSNQNVFSELSRFFDREFNDEVIEEFPSVPYELSFFDYREERSVKRKLEEIELSELVLDVDRLPREIKDYIELMKKEIRRLNHFLEIESDARTKLEEENKRLKEENFRLKNPIRRKRGRPRKNQ